MHDDGVLFAPLLLVLSIHSMLRRLPLLRRRSQKAVRYVLGVPATRSCTRAWPKGLAASASSKLHVQHIHPVAGCWQPVLRSGTYGQAECAQASGYLRM